MLAAIGTVETYHEPLRASGAIEGANFAGAAGPTQMGIGVGAASDAFRRFAIDGTDDGTAGPYDPADAIPNTTAFLSRRAVFSYNDADDRLHH